MLGMSTDAPSGEADAAAGCVENPRSGRGCGGGVAVARRLAPETGPRLWLRLGVIALPSRELRTYAAPRRADAAPCRADPSPCRADPAADARSEDARAVQHPSLELLGTGHRLEL